jgi:hypothetical protein
MKHLRTIAVVLGLAVYAVAFYAAPLPSVPDDAGRPLRRFDLLVQLLVRPDEWLLANWFGMPPGFSWADRLPILLTAAAIVAWATVLGWLLLRLCRVDGALSRAEAAVFATAVGLNALSTWMLLLGLFGVMGRLWVCTLPALLTLIAAGVVWGKTRTARPATADGPVAQMSAQWLWLGVPFVLAIFLAAMLPPLDFDVREYHLQAPKEFFQQGRITFLPHNVYANMTLGTEMLSLLGMVLTGDWWLGGLVGKTVIAAFTPLTAVGLLLAGRRLFSPAAGIVAALVYISVPWVVSIASAGLVEGASACYLLLALYALLLANRAGMAVQLPSQPRKDLGAAVALPLPPARSLSLLALSGYLAGGAVATKYPAALFVLLPLALWVLSRRASPPAKRPWLAATASLGVFLFAAMLACGLWFGKNWALSGNPTYPLLYGTFDGKTWNAAKEQQWNRVHRPHDFSAQALGHDLGQVLLGSEWLSPLLVPLAVLALAGGGYCCRLRWQLLAYVGFVIAVWWLTTHRIDRFWIPVLPVVALLAGAGAGWTPERWWRRLLAGLLVVGLTANFLLVAGGQANAWFVSLAQLRDAPEWIDPWHAYLNHHAWEGRVLLVGDAAVFDLKPSLLYNTCFDDCLFEQMVKGKTPSEARAALAAAHVTYIYVDWAEIARYRHTYGFTDFVRPAVFDRLVAEGLLEALPPIDGHPGRAYRVKSPKP